MAHKHGIWMHTDAVQAVGAIPVDVQELGVDMLSMSSHSSTAPRVWVRCTAARAYGPRICWTAAARRPAIVPARENRGWHCRYGQGAGAGCGPIWTPVWPTRPSCGIMSLTGC